MGVIRGESAYICPALGEEPVYRAGILTAHQIGNILDRGISEAFHYLSFGPINLNISRGGTVGWVLGVSAADIGNFEHHIRGSVFFPERDANILHAVT